MKQNRRDFFKVGLAMLAAPAAWSIFGSHVQAEEKRRAAAPAAGGAAASCKMAKPGVGMAAGINYQEDKSAVKDPKLKAERQGVTFDKQFCDGCMLYSAPTTCAGKAAGNCAMFASTKEMVAARGWCSSWSKKA